MMRSFARESGFPYDQYVAVFSRCHSVAMRTIHALGRHWYKPSYPDGDIVLWCHWCGDRRRA